MRAHYPHTYTNSRHGGSKKVDTHNRKMRTIDEVGKKDSRADGRQAERKKGRRNNRRKVGTKDGRYKKAVREDGRQERRAGRTDGRMDGGPDGESDGEMNGQTAGGEPSSSSLMVTCNMVGPPTEAERRRERGSCSLSVWRPCGMHVVWYVERWMGGWVR